MRAAILPIAVVVLLAMAGTSTPIELVGRAAAKNFTILRDDFERSEIGPAWIAGDSQAASGADFWGTSSARAFDGTRSAWCAQVGEHGATPNEVLFEYDDDMIAYIHTATANLTEYASLTLSFAFWLATEDGVDRLILGVQRDVGGVIVVYTNASSSAGWTQVTLTLPLETRGLEFIFMSNGMNVSEGAYVDAVELVGSRPGSDPGDGTSAWTLVAVAAAVGVASAGVLLIHRRRRRRGL